MSSVGDRIKAQRLHMGLTLKETANAIGVQEATVQRYESGVVKNIPVDRIQALAKALDISPSYLLGLTGTPDESVLSIPHTDKFPELADIEIELSLADDELLDTVHDICGMDYGRLPFDALSADVINIWNPSRINVITEFIKQNADILRKSMPNASEEQLQKFMQGRVDARRMNEKENHETNLLSDTAIGKD